METLIRLVLDAARQHPNLTFGTAFGRFGVGKKFQTEHPTLLLKRVIKESGGKATLRGIFYSEASRFAGHHYD